MDYEDYENYEEIQGYYEYEETVVPMIFTTDGVNEKTVTDTLMDAGWIPERTPEYIGSMEKLVFAKGDPNEVYSKAEIGFIEKIPYIIVYPEFLKKLNRSSIPCRAIAVKLASDNKDLLRTCIAFEKIIDKALNGFNLFLFATEESALFGCKLFDSAGHEDCLLSMPITSEPEMESILNELGCIHEEWFTSYYAQVKKAINPYLDSEDSYEDKVIRRRGMQFSYLEEISKIEDDLGISLSAEKQRYYEMFENDMEIPFSELIGEVEESLSFIQSNKINTYEMLFDAEEMDQMALRVEREQQRVIETVREEESSIMEDEELKSFLDDPEEMIKLIKMRKGIE